MGKARSAGSVGGRIICYVVFQVTKLIVNIASCIVPIGYGDKGAVRGGDCPVQGLCH